MRVFPTTPGHLVIAAKAYAVVRSVLAHTGKNGRMAQYVTVRTGGQENTHQKSGTPALHILVDGRRVVQHRASRSTSGGEVGVDSYLSLFVCFIETCGDNKHDCEKCNIKIEMARKNTVSCRNRKKMIPHTEVTMGIKRQLGGHRRNVH
jgi:hypothetical protein